MPAALFLVLSLCSPSGECRESRPILEPMSPIACVIAGQQAAADFLAEHPSYRIGGWRCERAIKLPA